MNIEKAIENVTIPAQTMLQKKVRARRAPAPALCDDPRAELRRLVQEHRRWTNTAKSWGQSVSDRTNRETGEPIPCNLPEALRSDIKAAQKALQAEAKRLESAMTRQLRQVPVYEHFLSKVYGVGPIAAAYLVAMVRIDLCTKPSQLWRYCGNAIDSGTGRLERRHSAPKAMGGEGSFNSTLRTVIWTAFQLGMWMTGTGKETKYLRRWRDAVHSRKTMGRERGAHVAGRMKATDLFLEDLYIIWRTLEGLPVWPDLYSVRRGFHHGGKPCLNEGRVLTLDEALNVVGDLSVRAMDAPAPSEVF